MEQITMKDAELVGGSGLLGWIGSQIISEGLSRIGDMVRAGEVDYSGLADEQGHYYNMVGA